MSLTVIADVLDRLYDEAIAETSIAAGILAETVRVFDGPPTIDWAGQTMIVIGGRVDMDDEDSSQDLEWEWATLGVNGSLAEIDQPINVPCGLSTRDGSRDMRTVRRTALTYYAALAEHQRGSTLNVPQVMWCVPVITSIRQIRSADGVDVQVDWTVKIQTRI